MSKFICKYCGMSLPIYKRKGPHIGEWCSFCQRWARWIPKQEINLRNNTVEKEVTPTVKTIDDILDDEVPWI